MKKVLPPIGESLELENGAILVNDTPKSGGEQFIGGVRKPQTQD